MKRERFLVKSLGDNIDGTKAGLNKMLQLLNQYNSAVIVVPRIGQVQDTMLTDVLGEQTSKELIKKRVIEFQGKKISLCGYATLKNYKYDDVYLDLWGSEHSIAKIEELPQCKAIVLVTWSPKDSKYWEEINNPTVIFDDKKG